MERSDAGSIGACFATLDDPRVERTKWHTLEAIVTIALCGVVCGAEGWVEIAEFGRAKEEWLARVLDLPHGIPSHDTFGRVFAALDPTQFEACFREWIAGVGERLGLGAVSGGAKDSARRVIALDGKTLRRSHDRGAGLRALHLVSAWASDARLVLAQRAVRAKANELGALPEVLQLLALEGCIVTIDAMGCHASIAQAIVDKEADYVLALKDNQPRLSADVQALFADAQAIDFVGIAHATHRQVDGGHGRVEIRQAWAITDPAHLRYLDPDGAWPNLRSIGMVRAERRVGDQTTQEVRYYLSSLDGAGVARALNAAVRAHWGIENGLHWVLDVAFREDESRVRTGHAAHNLALLRRIALTLLQHESTARCGIKAKRLKAGWDHRYLLKVLAC
jgi:predicted transposase YbfD/YdcC